MSEREIQTRIHLSVAEAGSTVFRQNVGLGWAGEIVDRRGAFLTLKNPRPLHAGLVKGSSDLIGWTPIVINSDLLGERLAVFTAIECKTSTGRATADQSRFIKNVLAAGGLSGIARNENEAREILRRWDTG